MFLAHSIITKFILRPGQKSAKLDLGGSIYNFDLPADCFAYCQLKNPNCQSAIYLQEDNICHHFSSAKVVESLLGIIIIVCLAQEQ